MSLTAFQRIRRMKQVEEMKPENIEKQEEIIEQPKEENIEQSEERPTTSRRRRN